MDVYNVTTISFYSPETTTNATTFDKPFTDSEVAICASFIIILMVVGIIANSLTIVVIGTYKDLNQNVFIRFILSLCFSDLLSSFVSWLFLYRRTWGFDSWDLPDGLCKFFWGVDIMTSYVTALHILIFASLRFISIQFPLTFRRITLMHGNICITLIWIVCFCSGFIPSLFIFDAQVPNRNSELPSARWPACTAKVEMYDAYVLFQQIGFTIFFYVPTAGVVVMCLAVVGLVTARLHKKVLSEQHQHQQSKEKNAVIQLLLIIFSFLLGYIPFSAYELWSVGQRPNTEYNRKMDYWFGMVSYITLRFSECLNPFFYNLGSSKVYFHTKLFLTTKLCFCKKKQMTAKVNCEPKISGISSISENM